MPGYFYAEMLAVWEMYVFPGLSLAAVESLSIAWAPLIISHVQSCSPTASGRKKIGKRGSGFWGFDWRVQCARAN